MNVGDESSETLAEHCQLLQVSSPQNLKARIERLKDQQPGNDRRMFCPEQVMVFCLVLIFFFKKVGRCLWGISSV